MIEEREKREADQKAAWEAMEQAALKRKEEERNRIAALTPEQRVADLEKCVSKRIDEVAEEVGEAIDSNASQFVNDRLPWSLNGDCYERESNLRSDIAKIMEKYLDSEDVIDGDEIGGEFDIVGDLVSEVISGMIHSVGVTYDTHFTENSEEYKTQRAELVVEVMKLFESRKREIAEERDKD
jgi:hypothetical protein